MVSQASAIFCTVCYCGIRAILWAVRWLRGCGFSSIYMCLAYPTSNVKRAIREMMITLLAVYSIWNVTFYLINESGGALSSLSPLFVLILATFPNAAGAILAFCGGLNSGYDKDTRLFVFAALSPLISVGTYHLLLSELFSNPIEHTMFAYCVTVILSFAVLCLLTLIVECLTTAAQFAVSLVNR